jgi:hypothetical protein
MGPKTTDPAQRPEREIYALRHAVRSAIEVLDEMMAPDERQTITRQAFSRFDDIG